MTTVSYLSRRTFNEDQGKIFEPYFFLCDIRFDAKKENFKTYGQSLLLLCLYWEHELNVQFLKKKGVRKNLSKKMGIWTRK